ncbi:MAG: hypothetical protein QOD41_1925 [Cryptosporangiaceae bacterium]|nr:hypothetical protein [Cryptosporangiaceae bacterium]
MRWTGRGQIPGVARRRAWLGLLVFVIGTFLFLDWAAASPESALTPEAGGPVPGVSVVTQLDDRTPRVVNEAAGQAASAHHSGREWGHVTTTASELDTQTNPLDVLVDGPAVIRFLGFTAISHGFAVVVLVFFWSYRSNLRQ